MGLQKETAVVFHAGVHQKPAHEIQAHCFPMPATLPILTGTQKYGSEAQSPLPPDTSHKFNKKEIKVVQKIVGSILYYTRAMDILTVLMALGTIASKQTKGTELTMEKAMQLMEYLATHPGTKVLFRTSYMLLNILDSNMAYLSETQSRSRACGHFFLGWLPVEGEPIRLNGVFHTLCSILCFVVASVVKAKLRALFLNCQEGIIFQSTLKDLDHP
jgi:hypothetical protein